MVEIKGELFVTFKVRDVADIDLILTFCKQFENKPSIVKRTSHELDSAVGRRPTKAQTQARIISLLKETFPTEGFTTRDAAEKVLAKLDLRETTTKHALTKAKKEGTLMRSGRVYCWTEVIQQNVAAGQQAGHTQPIDPKPAAEVV